MTGNCASMPLPTGWNHVQYASLRSSSLIMSREHGSRSCVHGRPAWISSHPETSASFIMPAHPAHAPTRPYETLFSCTMFME